MGSKCSSGLRRSRTRNKDDGQLAPPPYEPGRRSSDQLQKEDPPELSAHPALRGQVMLNSVSTTSETRPPRFSAMTLVNERIAAQVHLGSSSPTAAGHSQTQLSTALIIEDSGTRITASTTPLWRWTNSQCQSWISAVLVEYAGKPTEQANELASDFRGWGPNLYMKEWKQWNSWLGQDGQAIFALLIEVHGEEGAVPVTVEIAHYALEDKKRAEREKRSRREEPRREGSSTGKVR